MGEIVKPLPFPITFLLISNLRVLDLLFCMCGGGGFAVSQSHIAVENAKYSIGKQAAISKFVNK